MNLPSVMGRAEMGSGSAAPPPPAGLPSMPSAPSKDRPPGATPAPAAPAAPKPGAMPPPRPGALPAADGGAAAAGKGYADAVEEAPTTAGEEEEADGVQDDSWRQYLEDSGDEDSGEDSEPGAQEDSGEDSDADTGPRGTHTDRHKNDMEMLLRQQAAHNYQRTPASQQRAGGGRGEHDEVSLQSLPVRDCSEASRAAVVDDSEEEGEVTNKQFDYSGSPAAAPAGRKVKGFMSRLFGSGRHSARGGSAEPDPSTSMLNENITEFDDAWYGRQLTRLQRDGVSCTKVATNGKPYERRIHVDSRNLTIEIRGGRTGATGVLLDDLIDVQRGLSSPEFELFSRRFRKETAPVELAERALVLQTPHRSFSFLLPTVTHRGTVAYCIIFLLKSKDRGVMASGVKEKDSVTSTKSPKDGYGSVTYPNRSKYEGQFRNYMRHGTGALTLSDGTKYESEWRIDERHGEGKEICPDGTTFAGSYVKGMRHGHGVMTWPEGSKYSGEFERGRANGEGELLRTDGSVYRGQFSEDCMSGEGRMQWRDGVEYSGQFVGNRREGFGRMHWTSGRWKSYEGQWKDGLQHGEGTLVDHSTQEFKGTFRAGKLERWDDDA